MSLMYIKLVLLGSMVLFTGCGEKQVRSDCIRVGVCAGPYGDMFQHSVYLKKFCEEHSLELSDITEIPTAAMGVFSSSYGTFEEAEGSLTVAIPNDDTNFSRVLRVLEQTGVITVNPNIDASNYSV